MSHERSTPSSSGTADFEPSTSTSHQFTKPHAALAVQHGPLTDLEAFCVGKSDSTFNALAGAAGGFASGVVTCPLDVIKTKLQAQGGFQAQHGGSHNSAHVVYRGMLGTARIIWREEGLRGMYRGLGPIILGYLPTWAVWFTVYGKSKEFFVKYNGMLADPEMRVLITNFTTRQPKYCQFLLLNCCGSLLNHGY
jgi:solute carrier family 25 folate transporter 32